MILFLRRPRDFKDGGVLLTAGEDGNDEYKVDLEDDESEEEDEGEWDGDDGGKRLFLDLAGKIACKKLLALLRVVLGEEEDLFVRTGL